MSPGSCLAVVIALITSFSSGHAGKDAQLGGPKEQSSGSSGRSGRQVWKVLASQHSNPLWRAW